MSQHDFNITQADADAGVDYRAAVNAALQALGSCSSGPTAPVTTYAYQLWADTTKKALKIRDEGNSSWLYAKDYFANIGGSNSAIGVRSLESITNGQENSVFGYRALSHLTTGSENIAMGVSAGEITSTAAYNSIPSKGIFIGNTCKPLNISSVNEIVIGYEAVGNGSNTTTIGNNSTVRTVLPAGNLNIKTPSVPATSTSTGVKGDIAYDANYVYVCVATNTWKRSALSTW